MLTKRKLSGGQDESQKNILNEKLMKMRDEANQIESPIFSLKWIEETATLAKNNQVGNCNEKSCYAFMYLKEACEELANKPRIELFNNPFLDHFFVVLNRPEGIEHDQSTWIGAVICDPWADEVYEVTEENLAQLQIHKTAFLTKSDSLTKEVITKGNIDNLEYTIDIAGITDQPKIVLRQQLNFDKNLQCYVEAGNLNPEVPITFDPGTDYRPSQNDARGSTATVKAYNKQLVRNEYEVRARITRATHFFDKSRESKPSKETSEDIVNLITSYLYKK